MGVIVRLFLAVCVALTAAFPAFAGQCPIKGPRIRWQADYCMWKVGSDDIIAADPCMRSDDKRHYRNECEAKQHYKREMCRMAMRNRAIEQSEAQCMKDPSFAGPTVSNNGVGG